MEVKEDTDDNPGDTEKGGAETDGMGEGASKSAAGDGIPTDISGGINDSNPSLQDQTMPSLLNRLKQLRKQNASYCCIHILFYIFENAKKYASYCHASVLSLWCMQAFQINLELYYVCVCVCVCLTVWEDINTHTTLNVSRSMTSFSSNTH